MADIQIVMEVLGEKSIVSATNSTIRLENNIKSLSKSFDAGRLDQKQFDTALKELRKNLDKNGQSWQANKAYIDQYVRGLRESQRAQEEARAAQERLNQARQRAATALALAEQRIREETAAEKARTEAIKKNKEALDRFRSSYDSVYSAEQKYLQLTNLLRQALENKTITWSQAREELTRYKQAIASADHAQTGFGKSMNRTGVITQQAGYQVGDFLVQIQSGTNPMVAFGQQATQLVGSLYYLPPAALAARTSILGLSMSFGAMLPIIGIALPLITALGAAWMRSKEASDGASASTKNLESSLSSARSEVQGMKDDLELLASGLKETFELTFTKNIKQLEDDLVNATAQLEILRGGAEGFGAASGNIGQLVDVAAQVFINSKIAAAKEAVFQANLELETARELSRQEERRSRDASVANQLYRARLILREQEAEKQKEEEEALAEQLKLEHDISVFAMTNTYEKQQQASAAMTLLQNAIKVYEQEKAIREEIGDSAVEALKLAGVDITTGINSAAKAAAQMATQLGISYSRAMDIMTLGSEYQEASVRAGVASGAIPDVALNYLPKTPAQEAMDKLLEGRRNRAQRGADAAGSGRSGGGGGATTKTAEEYLSALMKEADYKNRLVGLSEEEARVKEIVYEAQKQGITVSEAQAQVIASVEAATRKQIEAEKQREAMMNSIQNNIESAFMSMVDGSKSVLDAFKDMLRNILLEIYKQKVVTPMAEGIMSLFMAKGGAFSNGVQMFANGGVVGSPTMFGHSGGLGVMGEAGPEAIMPLKRGSDGKLGVAGGGNVTVHQTFNFAANGDDSVKRIIAQAAPQIAQMTQKQIMDSRRRGGQMKATFS